MHPFFLSCLAAFLFVLVLGGYFYKQNKRKHSLREVLKILSLGSLSIVAVLIFHQWLLDSVVVKLKILWPFLNGSFASAFLELFLLLLFIAFFILTFAFLHAMSLRLFYGLPWKRNFMTIYNRIYNLTPILIFFLSFLLIDGIFNLTVKESFVLSLGGATIVFAVLEEYFKYMINPFLVYKKINSINTAMVHAIYVGLIFAFIENILFFYYSFNSPEFQTIVIYRSIFTTFLHVGASGLLGYFYGISLFAESMLTNYEIEKSNYYIPVWLRGFVKKTAAFQSVSITQGFFLAALLHALFNLLLHLNMIILAASLATFLTLIVIVLLYSKIAKIQYGLIGGREMPTADFEKLRLQISVLEHVKEIQKERLKLTKDNS